ncbi:MAG: hypothetical protein K2H86_04340 [Muribaculaceae bacterium]|nr:hypothetical protein [Muribaculaceae bacterium]
MMTTNIYEDKIALCFREIILCRKVLNTKRADEVSARLVAIYILLRTDDITKLWCHSFPKESIERVLADEAKNKYNAGFRQVRDKIGAHYQSADATKSADILASSQLFYSFDLTDIDNLVDELMAARDLLENTEHTYEDVVSIQDFAEILRILDEIHDGDKACLTTSSIELFGINRGGLISCSKEQRKGQFLRSIELMVSYAKALAEGSYRQPEVKRMFTRLWASLIYSYHDNLFTRTDISPKASQYEEGFDRMYMKLVSSRDDPSKLENIFTEFDNLHHTSEFFRRNRDVRDHACAHLDEKSSVSDIDSQLNGLPIDELYRQYDNMLNLFNYLCRNIFCLTFLSIEPRSPLPGARFETIVGNRDFYGREPVECEQPQNMSPDEILRSLRKNDSNRELAETLLIERLRSQNDELFYPMIEAITHRFEGMNTIECDLCPIFIALHNARRCFPERLQDSLLILLTNNNISDYLRLYILREIASLARRARDYDLWSDLTLWMQSEYYPIQAFGFLAGLHFLMSDSTLNPTPKTKPLAVNTDYANLLDDVTDPIKKLGIILLLNQHWRFGDEYQHIRNKETDYDSWLKDSLNKDISKYADYIHLNNQEIRDLWSKYDKGGFYLCLLHNLIISEKERNADPNMFLELWRWNAFIRYRPDKYEALSVALMDELNGNIDVARDLFIQIAADNPADACVYQMLRDFNRRNKPNR